MAVFGNDIEDDLSLSIENTIVVGIATMGATDGIADSISATLNVTTDSKNAKCAIYDSSFNLITNGQTDEVEVPTQGASWTEFAFSAPKPSLTANTTYYLACWLDAGFGEGRIGLNNDNSTVKTDIYGYDGTFPSSLPTPTWTNQYSTYTLCIYCTYTESAPSGGPGVGEGRLGTSIFGNEYNINANKQGSDMYIGTEYY